MATSKSAHPSNRRRSQRARARRTVLVQCRKGAHGFGHDLASTLLDISDSGVRLILKQPLDEMTEVEILINGYGMKQLIKRLGYVRWLVKLEDGQHCAGIEFQKSLAYREWLNLITPN